MTEILSSIRDWVATPGFAPELLLLVLKGVAILLVASMVGFALRRAPAALRHLCWSLSVAALVLLPILTLTLPSWRPALLPPPAVTGAAALDNVKSSAAGSTDAASPTHSTSGVATEAANEAQGALASDSDRAALAAPTSWTQTLLMVWLAGVGLILLYMLAGTLGAWHVVTRARPLRDETWLEALDEIVDRLDVRRPIQMLRTPAIRVPMVWGVLRPVVLLPESADEWDGERRRCVLAHELAHVKRWDALTQTVAGFACAVHWMNPLVWQAARRMRLEREIACDDYVLRAARTRASDYANHLIDIARQAPVVMTTPVSAVAMARRSQLEGRVLSILEDRARRALPRASALVAVVAALLLILPVAAFRPVAESAAPTPGKTRTEAPARPEAKPAAKPVPAWKSEVVPENAVAGQVDVKFESDTDADTDTDVESIVKAAIAPDVISRSFDVSPGGKLTIESDNGDILVQTGGSNRVEIEIHRQARGNASVEDFTVSSQKNGNEVEIVGESRRFSGNNGVAVRYLVTVPRRFNLELETGGGSIEVESLDGVIAAETSGGNLKFGRITGPIQAETSGGNITLIETEGNVNVETSGGEIRIGRVKGTVHAETSGGSISVEDSGGDINVATSGGNIRLGRIGGTISAETSGGNIEVEEVSGSIQAETSGGNIVARISRQPAAESVLATSGGGITVYLAEGLKLDVVASTSGGTIDTEFPITTRRMDDDFLDGTLNGGGPRLVLEGDAVRIRRL